MNNNTELNRLCMFFAAAIKKKCGWPPKTSKTTEQISFGPSILHNQLIIKFSRSTFITGNRASVELPKGICWVFQMCFGHHSFQDCFCVTDMTREWNLTLVCCQKSPSLKAYMCLTARNQKSSSYFQLIDCTVSKRPALLLHCLNARNNSTSSLVLCGCKSGVP